jgi:hypothetical protein
MAKVKGGKPEVKKVDENRRQNEKAFKKRPKIFDPIKRRLVTKQN